MQCCGPVYDMTTMDDRTPVFICGRCGKQGPPSMFSDRPPAVPPMSRVDRVRAEIADVLDRLAYWIAPK
jgi:hypothetical protein